MSTTMFQVAAEYRGLSDNDCMGALGQGDGSALAELVRRYEARLTRYLGRLVNDGDKAHDLSQETFLKIYRYREVYRTDARFATWLFHIARNLARDELRARRRRVRFASVGEAQELPAASPRILDDLGAREEIERVLERLPDRDRTLLVMRDVEGLSYEEVAERARLPLGTVKSGLSRARRRFRELATLWAA